MKTLIVHLPRRSKKPEEAKIIKELQKQGFLFFLGRYQRAVQDDNAKFFLDAFKKLGVSAEIKGESMT